MAKLMLWSWQVRTLHREYTNLWMKGPPYEHFIEFPGELIGVLEALKIINPDKWIDGTRRAMDIYRLSTEPARTLPEEQLATKARFAEFRAVLKAYEEQEGG